MARPIDPNSKAGKMRAAVYAIYLEHVRLGTLPTSARTIYYELIANGTVLKDEDKRTKSGNKIRPDQDVSKALTTLREWDKIPWETITDETRSLIRWDVVQDIEQGARAAVAALLLDPWENDAPLIIVESRSILGMLRATAGAYRVPIASTNGQVAGFLHTTLVPYLAARETPRVLYVGDWDFGGHGIEANTRRVLEEKVSDIDWSRVALTEAQVRNHNLAVIQKWDARTESFHDAVETEALPQAELVASVVAVLDDLLPRPVAEVDEEGNEVVERLLGLLPGDDE